MNSLKRTTCGLSCLVGALIASTIPAEEPAAPSIFSADVRQLGAGRQDASATRQMPQPAMSRQDATGPTLPGGKLPQYQLDHRHRELATEAELNDPRLRFLLALPRQPLLIDAVITIDGQPFRLAREKRIRQLLEDLKREPEPTPEPEADFEVTPDSVSQSDAESSVDDAASPEDSADGEPASDESGDSDEDAESGEEATEVTPPSVPAYSLPSSVLERLRRQVKVTGEEISVDELRWLLTNWVDGPNLLLLKDHFQRFRANQRPVFNILDRDRDGTVSADELAQAVASFEECDLNRNDIVDYSEIERSAADPRRRFIRHSGAGRLIFLLPDEKNAAVTYTRLAAACDSHADVPAAVPMVPRFDANANGQFDSDELEALRKASPDLKVLVTFNSVEPTKAQLTVEVPQAEADRLFSSVVVTGGPESDGTVTLIVDGQLIEFSAVQDAMSDQVSLGAVNDGYPLLAAIDPNDDGRFTIRERRTLTEALTRFDRNQDGSLSSSEAQATIRVCFGLGATVHRELAELRRVDRGPQQPATPGPGWFVRMDRNKDNDLSRKEFPGTDEQFAELDADSDLLISAEEARNASP